MAKRIKIHKSAEPAIAGLQSGWKWEASADNKLRITYINKLNGNYGHDIREILNYIQSIVKIEFIETNENSDITFCWTDKWKTEPGFEGGLDENYNIEDLTKHPMVCLNTKLISNRSCLVDFHQNGSFTKENFLHEMGHALGLRDVNQIDNVQFPKKFYDRFLTLMINEDGFRTNNTEFGVFDIAVLNIMYS